jgi:hypothetical protein
VKKPRRHIYDKAFVYTPASHTSVAATFERVRKQISEGASSATPERSGADVIS